jgi:hypothetical protein
MDIRHQLFTSGSQNTSYDFTIKKASLATSSSTLAGRPGKCACGENVELQVIHTKYRPQIVHSNDTYVASFAPYLLPTSVLES